MAWWNFVGDIFKGGKDVAEVFVENKEAKVVFTNVPDGVYAVSCYHDEDSNGELNMFMGMIPSEPYGCSNGARGFFGPPKWEDAHFEVNEQETRKLDIRL